MTRPRTLTPTGMIVLFGVLMLDAVVMAMVAGWRF
jgi:hypothetical protein